MKEKIERLARGIFEYEMPELIVSEKRLQLSAEAGKKRYASICIKNKAGKRMKGILYVTGKVLSLQETEFFGTECEIAYEVNAEFLQAGEIHTGIISIISDCGEMQIPFAVTIKEPETPSHKKQWEDDAVLEAGIRSKEEPVLSKREAAAKEMPWKTIHRLEYKLTEQYLLLRNNVITRGAYLAESERILESVLILLDRSCAECEEGPKKEEFQKKKREYELYRIYLAIADEKNMDREVLYDTALRKRSQFERDGETLPYCITLYLEAMMARSAALTEKYAKEIQTAYEQNPNETMLLWLSLYMDKRFKNDRQMCYAKIKEHCKRGRYSPILLYEAGAIWKENPLMIHYLTPFECHVVQYLIKSRTITRDLALQVAYLSDKNTEQEQLQLQVLCRLYEIFQHKDILYAVCRKIIARNARGTHLHPYLQQGIREQLRMDRLYEFYLYTIDRTVKQKIDPSVLLYFSFSNSLSEEDMAYLYAYVVRNKEEIPAIYRAYFKRMEQFAVHQIKAGAVNDYLAVLYADVLKASMIDREMAQSLPDIIFTYRLECSNPAMESVLVQHKEEKTAVKIPLRQEADKKTALFPIYTKHAELRMVDNDQKQHPLTESEHLYRLMQEESLLEACYEAGSDNRRLLLYLAEKKQNCEKKDRVRVDLLKRIAALPELKEEVKNSAAAELVQYYYENYDGELLETYLRTIRLELLNEAERERMAEMMAIREMYEEVMQAVDRFGCELLQTKQMAGLCLKGICSKTEERDRKNLLSMAIRVFRSGYAEERLLSYLVTYYNGTTEEMEQIWSAARELELDTAELEERLLGQMLFAESHLEHSFPIFLSYCRTGQNKKLIRAYLSYSSYRYFVREEEVHPQLFALLKKETFIDSSQICVLALLKWYAEKEVLTDAEKSFIELHIQRFVQKKTVFAVFKKFDGKLPLPACVTDKYYIEYRTDPKNKVTFCYTAGRNGEEKEENMTDIGYGIFVKEWILFYGERLDYRIKCESKEGQTVENCMAEYTESPKGDGNTKYKKLNEILAAIEKEEEQKVYELLEECDKEAYAVKRHFTPI